MDKRKGTYSSFSGYSAGGEVGAFYVDEKPLLFRRLTGITRKNAPAIMAVCPLCVVTVRRCNARLVLLMSFISFARVVYELAVLFVKDFTAQTPWGAAPPLLLSGTAAGVPISPRDKSDLTGKNKLDVFPARRWKTMFCGCLESAVLLLIFVYMAGRGFKSWEQNFFLCYARRSYSLPAFFAGGWSLVVLSYYCLVYCFRLLETRKRLGGRFLTELQQLCLCGACYWSVSKWKV